MDHLCNVMLLLFSCTATVSTQGENNNNYYVFSDPLIFYVINYR